MSLKGDEKGAVAQIVRRQLQRLREKVGSATQTDRHFILQTLCHEGTQLYLSRLQGRQRTLL